MSTPLWRTALTDSNHELHQAAWLIFAPGVSVGTTKDRLADQKDAITALLTEIIDDDYLYDEEAPGNGTAPISAIYLIGEWQLVSALPSMLELLELGQSNDQLREAVITAVGNFGSDIVPDLMAWGDENPEFSMEVADWLSDLAQGNEAAFQWVAKWIEKEDNDIEFYIEVLLEIDPNAAETYLDGLSENNAYSKDAQKLFRQQAREAKKVAKEALMAKLDQAEPEAEAETEAE